MPRFDTKKKLDEVRTSLNALAQGASNQPAIALLQDILDVLEEMHYRVAATEKECCPPESFIHEDGPHRLK